MRATGMTIGLMALAACGTTFGHPQDAEPAAFGPYVEVPEALRDAPLADGAVTTLVLPVIPVTDVVVASHATSVDGALRARADLTMGWASGYPTELSLAMGAVSHEACPALSGELRVQEVWSSNPEIAAVQGDQLTLEQPGYARLSVKGQFHPADGACPEVFVDGYPIPIEIEVTVAVVQPFFGTAWQRPEVCAIASMPQVVLGATTAEGLLPAMRSRCALYQLANATAQRQVSLTLVAPAGGGMLAPADGGGLDQVRFVGAPGVVRVTADSGDTLDLHVISPEAVTDMHVDFFVPWALGTSHMHLQDDDEVVWSELEAVQRQVVAKVDALYADIEPLCSLPDDDRFEMVGCGTAITTEVGVGVAIEQDGNCELTLHASELGDGLSQPLSISFFE